MSVYCYFYFTDHVKAREGQGAFMDDLYQYYLTPPTESLPRASASGRNWNKGLRVVFRLWGILNLPRNLKVQIDVEVKVYAY